MSSNDFISPPFDPDDYYDGRLNQFWGDAKFDVQFFDSDGRCMMGLCQWDIDRDVLAVLVERFLATICNIATTQFALKDSFGRPPVSVSIRRSTRAV
jgi:hypothetical protein